MKKYLYFLLILLLFGCVHSHDFYQLQNQGIQIHRYVHIDPQYGGIERKIIENALQEWNSKTGGFVRWTVKDWPEDYATHAFIKDPEETENQCSNHLLIMRGLSTDQMVISVETDLGQGVSGYAYSAVEKCGTEYIVLVTDKLDNHNFFRLVVLHELGHILGLHHNDNVSIMSYKYMVYANGITNYDLDEMIKKYQ